MPAALFELTMFTSREKRRVKRAFENFVDPKSVESLLAGQVPPLKEARIDFIVAFVSGKDPHHVSERIAKVIEVATDRGATVHHVIGALAIVAFGTQAASAATPGNRHLLVAALREQLGGDIKIVHGAADGWHGLFGAKGGISYTFLVPEFDRVLGVLSRLHFGVVEEFCP
jgi:hypothetical protein